MNDSDLVSITDIEEQQTVMNLLPKTHDMLNPFWIGLHEPHKEGHWGWSDFTCGKFRNWEKGQPGNDVKDEDCAALWPRGDEWKWHDVKCNSKFHFVCKKCVKDCPSVADLMKEEYACPVIAKMPPLVPRDTQFEYAISKTQRRHQLAEKACVKWGGNLASFQNKQEESAVAKLIPYGDLKQYWIGLTERGRDGMWTWTDGTEYEYDNWRPGEPNNYVGRDEDCAMINLWGLKQWFDSSCASSLHYICQRPVGATPDHGILTIDDGAPEYATDAERTRAREIIAMISLMPFECICGVLLCALLFWGFHRRNARKEASSPLVSENDHADEIVLQAKAEAAAIKLKATLEAKRILNEVPVEPENQI